MSKPIDFAYKRSAILEDLHIQKYAPVFGNWDESQLLIRELRQLFESSKLNSHIKTIIAVGSIGRMEASLTLSDADLIIILDDTIDLGSSLAKSIYQECWHNIEEAVKVKKPKVRGMFSKATNELEIFNEEALGPFEHFFDYSKRLIILMEGQPLYRDDNFLSLRNKSVDFYAKNYVSIDPTKEWAFLLNDLIRFFRTGLINYRWDLEKEIKKWPLRNIKMSYSRLLMYSGLLLLLGESSKERQDKVGFLKAKLNLTPFERVAYVYEANLDWNFHRIAASYAIFLSQINDADVRESLENSEGSNQLPYESYVKRYDNPQFAMLKNNSDAFIAELLRFILARRGSWSERFYEYLIF